MSDKYKNLKVKELQEILQKNGLPHTGKKEELIERLVKHDEHKALELESLEAEFGNLEEYDDSKINLDELVDPELRSFPPEKKDDVKPTESASTNTTTTNIPNKTNIGNSSDTTKTSSAEPIVKEGSNFKFTPIVFDIKTNTATSTNGNTASSPKKASEPSSATTDAERKLERAKRFGVQVNEKTKQELRAARFGIQKPSTQTKKPITKGLDPEVLKKRAERFGLPDKNTKSAKPSTTLSPEEEEKKRKRAERFGIDVNKKQKS
ncbi:uncharacterized protein BX664DRAFT_362832 [Halteromyces radiatus]|uniref:uncharacterized protein n=1 Tax=Halteromyces radiatus TaxID=101107 RepID=UPI002220B58E|nr:uncharacterized protein BX664DRAFT_362832 [Halteromyces radiatus]KAI8076915.1 hypothetical protein BX664DRAFT_362832 [Halteromyces radiatus]